MSNSSLRPATVALAVAGAVTAGVGAYCVWFDHQRRHNPEFRRKLERQKAQLAKANRAESNRQRHAAAASLRQALAAVDDEPTPGGSPEEREQYFLEQVAVGEQLVARGPDFYVPAAVQFFKALKVYPAPQELLMIYQKTQPPAVFALITDCLSQGTDGSARIQELDSSPSSPARSRRSAGSDNSSPNGGFVQVDATD